MEEKMLEISDEIRESIRNGLGEDALKRTESLYSVTRELLTQTDRGAAIIGGAYLEDSLATYLKSCWRNDQADAPTAKSIARLFNPSGPLGSFSAKIDIAYLGHLIGPTTFADMHVIRDIRNDFAHKLSVPDNHTGTVLSFGAQSIAAKCGNLSLPRGAVTTQVLNHHIIKYDDSPKGRYIFTIMRLALEFGIVVDHPAPRLVATHNKYRDLDFQR
jgi:hypothetical protein